MRETDTEKMCLQCTWSNFILSVLTIKGILKEREHVTSLPPEQKSPNWRPLQKF